MKKIFYTIIAISFASVIVSCGGKGNQDKKSAADSTAAVVSTTTTGTVDVEKTKKELLAIDAEFSGYSEKNGMKEAFLNYIDDQGVLLRPNHKPIVGKDSATQVLNRKRYKDLSMTWTPLFADVSASGDMGYTYGTYDSKMPGGAQNSGTYVTIWKKDKTGKWKMVLDSGNDGLSAMKKGKTKGVKKSN